MKRPWTDADLLEHKWRIEGRPDRDPTLSRKKPPSSAKLRFLHDYNITPPRSVHDRLAAEPYVWCSLCQEATHWIGWVAEYEFGSDTIRTLVGQNCASRKGGESVKLAVSTYHASRDRAQILRARQATLEIAPAVRRALHAWGSSPGVAAVLEWRAILANAAPSLAKALEEAAGHSPPTLLVEREVRDFAAEEALSRRRRTQAAPQWRVEYQVFARLEGAALYGGPNPGVRIRRLAERFDNAVSALARPSDAYRTRELNEALIEVRSVADGARELERLFTGHEKGLSDRSIDTVLAWFDHLPKSIERPGSIDRKQRSLVVGGGAWATPRYHAIPSPHPITHPSILDGIEYGLRGGQDGPPNRNGGASSLSVG